MDLGGDRADETNSGHAYQLADQLEADLSLAARHHRRHRLAGRRPSNLSALARELICNAEVERIQVRGRRVAGVQVSDGTIYEAPTVIGNLTPTGLAALVDPALLGPEVRSGWIVATVAPFRRRVTTGSRSQQTSDARTAAPT